MIKNQSGNVLFYILIAVALIASLSFAVTQGNRENTGHLDDKKTEMSANRLIEYSNTVANAISQLRLRGCTETEISFENDLSATNYNNSGAPSDESCHVFKPNGGGVHYHEYDVIFTGDYHISRLGTSEPELMMDVRIGQSTCIAVNEALGVENSGVDGPPSDKLSTGTIFDGDYGSSAYDSNTRIEHSDLIGKTAFCRVSTGSGSSAVYRYSHIFLIR